MNEGEEGELYTSSTCGGCCRSDEMNRITIIIIEGHMRNDKNLGKEFLWS